MQDKYLEYRRCPDMESAIEISALLEKNNIDFEIDNTALRFQLVPSAVGLADVIVLVKEGDLEKANSLLPAENIWEVKEEQYIPSPDIINEEPEVHTTEATPVAAASPDRATVWVRGIFSALIFFVICLQGADLRFALILITVIFIHELGHFTAMKRFDYTDVKIFFIPFFGAATSGKPVATSQKKEAIVLLAGPVPGILAGLFLMHFTGETDHRNTLYLAGKIFVILNMVNLLPVFPLDGGKLVTNIFLKGTDSAVLRFFYVFSIAAFTYFALKWGEYWLLIIALTILPLLFKKKNKQGKPLAAPVTPALDGTTDLQFHDKLTLIIVWLVCLYAPFYMGFPNFLF